MKKLATIALLLTMLASLGACSQRGMYDASMWFQDQTNGRNTNLTVARGARSMWGTGMQRTADSVSVNTAMVELSKKDTRTPFTVERAATSLNDVNRKPTISVLGAAQAIENAQR